MKSKVGGGLRLSFARKEAGEGSVWRALRVLGGKFRRDDQSSAIARRGILTCLVFEDRCTGTCAMQAKEAHCWWGRRMCLEDFAGERRKAAAQLNMCTGAWKL